MTNPISDKRYRFSSVVYATGGNAKVIRNWLDRKQVTLEANEEREGQKWRRFSVWDAFRLAVIRRLVEFCIPVEAAGLIVGGLLVPHMLLLSDKNTPARALAAALSNTVLFAWREEQGWKHKTYNGVGERPEVPDAVVYVDIGAVAARVIDALQEIGEEY
ncbi:hypothetical protein FW320_26645 [Azospirillum sp. Vi22]|uniref:hypothetical protein n=1 Tax=Azospirillum baldaniorum TaxID=1064539 RepID=UPI00157A3F04|nr:hypothetical protein [Azospirillum baldaniorum]NUB09726.1 hypothetical protein [Azospirillum baldaniorum]